jgi:hypothetical protein
MRQLNITNDDQAVEFIEMLIAEDRVFHLDDTPEDIVWSRPIDAETLHIISGNWAALWSYCFPWDLFDIHPDLWDRYIGETERAEVQRDPETTYLKLK